MGIEIKTVLGTIAGAAQEANVHLGATAFGDNFVKELARAGRADGLTHLCIAFAQVSDKQFVYDFRLISAGLHGLQFSGLTHRVTEDAKRSVRKKLKKLRLA